jgi:glutathione S-transferase
LKNFDVLDEPLVPFDFIVDLFPNAGTLPTDPRELAKARSFVNAVMNTLIPAQNGILNDSNIEALLQALEKLQSFLPSEGFVLESFSLADIVIASFLMRLEAESQDYGQKIQSALCSSRLTRFYQYWKQVCAHPGVSGAFNKVSTSPS